MRLKLQKKNKLKCLGLLGNKGGKCIKFCDDVFIVNIIGCFLLGMINSLPISRRYKLIFGFGFCGSLTTFSGWSFQLFQLISKGLYKLFFLNLIFFVLIGFFAVGFGHTVAKKISV